MMGLDEETKLLSLTNISCIFIEECFEVPKDIVEQLDLRLRGKATNQQIIMAFNPISKAHWLYQFCEVNPPRNFFFSKTTYRDNPFLNKEYIETLEEMRKRNPDKAKVYTEGLWGVISDALVFKNWRIDDINPLELASLGLEHKVGSDLGFVDPTTVLESFYDAQNRKIYVFNEFYKSGVQLDTVASWIKEQKIKTKIWFDSAEPRSIDYFKRQGINAVPAIKGQNSVKARIQFLQNNEIIVSPSCPHLIEELENCQWAKNRSTNEYTDEISDHRYSHCLDGLGYSYSNIYQNDRLKSFDKKLLGL